VAVGLVSYVVAASMMVLSVGTDSPRIAAILLAVATAASMFSLGAHWAAAIDIGGDHAGVLSACMNTTGQIGSISSPIVAAWLVDHYASWALPLYVMAALYAFSAATWLFVRPPADHAPGSPARADFGGPRPPR
jgi:predicted MFS family arabinose efflux permease